MALRHVIFDALAPHFRIISIAGFIAGLYFLSIFHNFDRRCEIEEHGLTAGYATKYFSSPHPDQVKPFLKTAVEELGVVQALYQANQDAGLTTFIHSGPNANLGNSSLDGSRSSSSFGDIVSSDTVVYSHILSQRGDGRESLAVVLQTDWNKPAINALAMGVHLSKYFEQVKWLSRDVYMIFADRSEPYARGVRSWIDSYLHGTNPMPRSGLLRQAVVLDLPRNSGNSVLINVEGINGMLPNQDLPNTFIIDATNVRANPSVRPVWDSVLLAASNGQVHSAHGAFLDVQINCFTAEFKNKKSGSQIDLDQIGKACEGTIRSLSNILQQLHHSFNFYFYNSVKSHVSNGIYFYPIFAIMAPLASHLMMNEDFVGDLRCVLVGSMGFVVLIFFVGLSMMMVAVLPHVRDFLETLGYPEDILHSCDFLDGNLTDDYRNETLRWIGIGVSCGIVIGSIYSKVAKQCYKKAEKWDPLAFLDDPSFFSTRPSAEDDMKPPPPNAEDDAFTIPAPLWRVLRCGAGYINMGLLTAVLLLNFALSVPLTVIIVPGLLLAAPLNFRARPLRSIAICVFLLLHLSWLHEETRLAIVDVLKVNVTAFAKFLQNLMSGQEPKIQRFLPIKLADWFAKPTSMFWKTIAQDPVVALYRAARDYRCVDGWLFPAFCFIYLPFVLLIFIIAVILPEQQVVQENISMKDIKIFTKAVVCILGGALTLGIVWRSTSSAGLQDIKI